jgi:hypothetical protein
MLSKYLDMAYLSVDIWDNAAFGFALAISNPAYDTKQPDGTVTYKPCNLTIHWRNIDTHHITDFADCPITPYNIKNRLLGDLFEEKEIKITAFDDVFALINVPHLSDEKQALLRERIDEHTKKFYVKLYGTSINVQIPDSHELVDPADNSDVEDLMKPRPQPISNNGISFYKKPKECLHNIVKTLSISD